MKLKAKVTIKHNKKYYAPGEIVETDTPEILISAGLAEPIEEKPAAPAAPKTPAAEETPAAPESEKKQGTKKSHKKK